jgi:xanthine dehydrogenase accessory factor
MTDPIVIAARRLLDAKKPFVIATIITREGSAPRTAGTKMIISADSAEGTIGGGTLEARVQKKAAAILGGQSAPILMPYDLTSADTAAMDMICGGKGSVLLDLVTACDENLALFQKWETMLESLASGWFVTIVKASAQATEIETISHCVVDPTEEICGGPSLDAEVWKTITAAARRASAMKVLQLDGTLAIIEPAQRPTTVYFFGAGHVAQPSLQMAAMTGFRTVILDDREAFANRERFPEAEEIHVIADFKTACENLNLDESSFIVIFTRGHHHDHTVLAQALKTDAAYIGMIGSKRKRDAIFSALMKEGFGRADIERVHSPIGLAINAETPEEIGVSIIAELIQERAKLRP